MPLSRSISRTASMISWLISHPLVDQVRPHDLVVRDLGLVDRHVVLVGEDDLAAEPALARAELDPASDDAGEVVRLAEGPSRARRRDVDGVLAEVVAERVRHALAERVVDAGRMVDVDRELVGAVELDREHLDAVEVALDAGADLALQ